MKAKLFCALSGFIAMLAMPVAFASVDKVTVQTEGTGSSLSTATASALSSAVAQVNGAEIASSALSTEMALTLDSESGSAFASSSATVEAVAQKTKGLVQNYRILSKAENLGVWTVSVEATITKYARSAQADRLRMTVLPFRMKDQKNSEAGNRVVMELTSYLTSSRKFAILDRDFEAERQAEMDVLASSDAPADEMVKLGNRLGTDYMIVGVITDSGTKTQSTTLAGRTLSTSTSNLSISYRVIDAPTGQIKFADTWSGSVGGSSLDSLSTKAADAIGRKIVDAIAPIRVESATGDTLFLGQGGSSVKVGQKYKLIMNGDEIIDSYTNESLGRQEVDVGLVEIIDVQSKIAKAKVIKSSVDLASMMATNTFIVRLHTEAAKPVSAPAAKKSAPAAAPKKSVESDW